LDHPQTIRSSLRSFERAPARPGAQRGRQANGSAARKAPAGRVADLFEESLAEAARLGGGRLPDLRDWVDLAEAWRIVHTLQACGGNRSEAARVLGIGRRTLYAKMEKLGVEQTFRLAPRWAGA